MIPVKHIDPEDLPLYAMQLLPAEENEELSLHLQHSPEARRVLAEIYGDLAVLAHREDCRRLLASLYDVAPAAADAGTALLPQLHLSLSMTLL